MPTFYLDDGADGASSLVAMLDPKLLFMLATGALLVINGLLNGLARTQEANVEPPIG